MLYSDDFCNLFSKAEIENCEKFAQTKMDVFSYTQLIFSFKKDTGKCLRCHATLQKPESVSFKCIIYDTNLNIWETFFLKNCLLLLLI